MSTLLLNCLCVVFFCLLLQGDCIQMENDLCGTNCAGVPTPDLSFQRGMRYTYRYSTTISTSLHGANSGRNGLALDCVVDIDAISKCHLIMQIRNSQIKRLSAQKEHSVQRFKSLRESLERMRLKFSLQGGKVSALCPQEGEQVWALNIKRALLSMLQTSYTSSKQDTEKETDIYGTCSSRYEKRGALLLKTRDLKQCHKHWLSDFWPHSTSLTEDTTVDSKLQCTQRQGTTVMQEVNCTESIAMATASAGFVKTQTVSTLILLRAQPGTPPGIDSLGPGVLTGLQFEKERDAGSGRGAASTRQQAGETVGLLCGLTSDQQQMSQQFLQLAFQLRDLSLSQLRTLWKESSFKCLDDWQPLLDALLACGSENCILLLAELMKKGELGEDQAHSYLTTIALTPHPSPQIITSINALLEDPELRNRALLAGSSLVYSLCRKSRPPCSRSSEVQTFMQTLKEALGEGCVGEEPARVSELFYALKAVGNSGFPAPAIISLLNRCALGPSTEIELRLSAIQAFRRMPCTTDLSVLLQLYRSSQEDPEVRIAAYQQLMRCPDPEVLHTVRTTLSNETSSQVGSFVWSHLTNILRSEDPVKQTFIESLPDDIISKDYEAEFWKYSSYSDHTVESGMGMVNLEGSLVFSPKSFLPRSAMANLTVYFHGRAHNLLEVDLRVENVEPLLRNVFGRQSQASDRGPTSRNEKHAEWNNNDRGRRRRRRRRRETEDGEHGGEKEVCSSSASSYLNQAKALLTTKRKVTEERPRCWVGVKVFGHEISALTCDDLYTQLHRLSLSAAGLAVKLLKGQEVQLHHRAVLMTEEFEFPSLSGMPVRLAVNMTSLLSLRLKGNAHYRDAAHFSLAGYIKPNAYVGLSAWMGVDGALGRAGVRWESALRSSTSLDGSVQLQEGRDLRVTLNTPEDFMDIVSLNSRVFQVSGDHKEEMKGPKSRQEKTTCMPKTWSKMVGWQLCSNVSLPSSALGTLLPPPGPAHLSLRLLKLDRGLHYYLLEAAYSFHTQSGSWLPRDASLHLLLATPHSSIPRDMSLDLALDPNRILFKITHPLKTIHIQGQLSQERNIRTGKLELSIDDVHHYFIMGLVDTKTVQSEQRMRYHLEAKLAPDGRPMILSANVTRGLGRKISLSATVKNVFKDTASILVSLERRLDDSSRQYSVEGELLLPGVVGSRILGLMEMKGPLLSSALRLKYGLGEESRNLRQECYMSQRLKRERDPDLAHTVRAEHEFYCSNTVSINHKVQLRHEESPDHSKSSLDVSYGKHWDEINNKRTLHLSQSFKNQSTQNHTSYTLEFSLQVPEKRLSYRTQLLHSHLRGRGSESSTHLKVNYNDLMPLVAGLQWKSPPGDALQKRWEGTFNMDTPWLYIYTAHKLSQPQQHTLQLTSELTARKLLTVRNLVLEGLYRDGGREKEARIHLFTPSLTYVKAGGWGVVGKQSVKASCSFSSLWTPPLRGDVSLEASKHSHTLQMASSYGKQNLSLAAALHATDKNLKKRQVMMRITLSEPRSPSAELELEGTVEELRKDQRTYQKTASLRLRQPFQSLPGSLLLRQTFTVDLLKGLYVLESRAGFHANGEVVHMLTLGYRLPRPFVCSALTHPFSSHTVPSDSELCVTVSSNQTQREVQGKLCVGSKEKMTFFGQVVLNPPHSEQNGARFRANISHLLQLRLPSLAVVEGDVRWNPKNSTSLDYLARGRLRVERQESEFSLHLNGTSKTISLYSLVRHPFKSKIPKKIEVHATADSFLASGRGSSLLRLATDGKGGALLGVQLSHSLHRGDRALGLRLNLSQNLLPAATDLRLNVAANLSKDSVSIHGSCNQGDKALLVQMRGSLNHSRALQLAVSGDLRHSLSGLTALPAALGLDGALGLSAGFTEGQLRVRVMERLYMVELGHHLEEAGDTWDGEDKEDLTKEAPSRTLYWLRAQSGDQHLRVNASRHLGGQRRGWLFAELSHSSHLLSATGVPGNNTAQVRWTGDGGQLSVRAELLAGAENLKTELNWGKTGHPIPSWDFFTGLRHHSKLLGEGGLPSSLQAKAHCQIETERSHAGLTFHVEEEKTLDVHFNVGTKNSTANLAVSLWQQIRQLKEVIPTSLQMNCTGDASADCLSGKCYGSIAGGPMENPLPPQLSLNGSLMHSSTSTYLNMHLQTAGDEKGGLSLSLGCSTNYTFKGSVRHSINAMQALGLPTHNVLVLSISTVNLPAVELGLEVGDCHFRSVVRENRLSEKKMDSSSHSVNVSHYCPTLQGTILPVSADLHGFLSLVPCQLTMSSTLRVDNYDLILDLAHTCRPPHLSGALTHSFPGLRSRGLPLRTTIEASGTGSPGKSGALLIKAGACQIMAEGITEARGKTQWLWAMDSKCPFLQAHLNGSVGRDSQDLWTAVVDSSLEKERASLQLRVKATPELRLEGQLNHNLSLLRDLPGHARLLVMGRAGTLGYDTEARLHIGQCDLSVIGAVIANYGLQGSVVYYNNCTMVQKWGCPNRIQASGSMVISQTHLNTVVSMAIDDKELQALIAVRKTKDKNETSVHFNHSVPLLKTVGLPSYAAMTINSRSHGNGSYSFLLNCTAGNQQLIKEMAVTMSSATMKVNSLFRHEVTFLKTLGVTVNNSIQIELSSAAEKILTLQSQFGVAQVGFRLKMKGLPMSTELQGTMWHSWPVLQHQGLPLIIEGLCVIKGDLSRLQSVAQLTVDGHKLLASGLNISVAHGRLAIMLYFNQPSLIQTGEPLSFDSVLNVQLTGPLRSLTADVRLRGRRMFLLGDVGGWGTHGATKEGRITMRHSVHGQTSPVFQVEAWGRLTDSQLKCSMAVNPELGASLAVIIQGQCSPQSKGLMVKVVQNIPQLLLYLPAQLNARSQLNQSSSSVGSLVEFSSGRRKLWALCELAAIEGGYRQSIELNHSYPQLKPVPRTLAVRTVYEARNWSYQVQHGAVWGNQEFTLAGLYSAPPSLEIGNHTLKVHMACVPRLSSLELTLERSLHGQQDSVLLGWTRHGRTEQMRALRLWSGSGEKSDTTLQMHQPFTATLSQLSLYTVSHSSQRGQWSNHEAHLSWTSPEPVNVTLTLHKQWLNSSRRGQACGLFSSKQSVLSPLKGCVSVAQEGTFYSQNAELRWENSSVKQGMKYQRGPRDTHTLQVNVGLESASVSPCPSHTLHAKIQSNLRDRLEHTVSLGLCPPQPSVSWSGTHKVNSGKELLYTQTRLSVAGRPHQCSLTLALINSSNVHSSNISLSAESRVGNWSVEVGGNVLSSAWGPQLQLQATLDHNESVWWRGNIDSKCLQTTVGYRNAQGPDEDLTLAACLVTRSKLTLDLKRREGGARPEALGTISLGTANHHLTLRAEGCSQSLLLAEAHIDNFSSQMRNKMIKKIRTLQSLLVEFRQQSRDGRFLQELSAAPLHLTLWAEAFLGQKDGGLWWYGSLRPALASGLPRVLATLHHASLLGQQELRRPLATAAGVYHDVTGQRLEVLWRAALSLCTSRLAQVLPALLENPQLRPLAQTALATAGTALDMAGQQTVHWAETKLATALSGIRNRLASVYKLSPSDCSVSVSVPLPRIPWARVAEAGVVQTLLEEGLLRPLQSLTSIRPTADFYRLKRRIMDSPFKYQALLIADQFVATFDGHLYELRTSCPVVLARGGSWDSPFALLLGSDAQSQHFLVVAVDNSTVSIHANGQVRAGCHTTHTLSKESLLAVRRGSHRVEVSSWNGVSVSCDLSLYLCSLTLDGWLHGTSTGLLGTNDNEAGNDFPLPRGSQATNMEDFFHSWQIRPGCKRTDTLQPCSPSTAGPVNCDSLFSFLDSPLSSCFKVVDPGQFLSVCKRSHCSSISDRSGSPCRLAAAFVHLCQQNYIPLELPAQCSQV